MDFKKMIRILGLLSIMGYMITIMITWINANYMGYPYFSAGEPILGIKYLEWFIGIIGICVAGNYFREEIGLR